MTYEFGWCRMTERVLAAVQVAPETTELREFALPDVDSDAALLKVEAAGGWVRRRGFWVTRTWASSRARAMRLVAAGASKKATASRLRSISPVVTAICACGVSSDTARPPICTPTPARCAMAIRRSPQ